jgi:hypothetical protein
MPARVATQHCDKGYASYNVHSWRNSAPGKALDFSGCNYRPESKHGYRFRDGKGCTSFESEVRLRFHLGSKPRMLLKAKPRAMREHFVVPSIRSLEMRDNVCNPWVRSRGSNCSQSISLRITGRVVGSIEIGNRREEAVNLTM